MKESVRNDVEKSSFVLVSGNEESMLSCLLMNISNIKKTLNMVKGKWKVDVIYLLLTNEKLRYKEIHRGFNGVSHKVLTEKLLELKNDKLVAKKIYPTAPLKVEYSITAKGRQLTKLLKVLEDMGEGFIIK